MDKPTKKINFKVKSLYGTTDYESYLIYSGSWVFDVSKLLLKLPDNFLLAFNLASHWRYVKDAGFTDADTGLFLGAKPALENTNEPQKEMVKPHSKIKELIWSNKAEKCRAFPLPIIFDSSLFGFYRGFRLIEENTTVGYTWASEFTVQLANEVFGPGLDFHCSGHGKMIYLVKDSQPVGCISPNESAEAKLTESGIDFFKNPLESTGELSLEEAAERLGVALEDLSTDITETVKATEDTTSEYIDATATEDLETVQ